MKTITCDKCKKSKPLRYDESYPKDFVLVKVFMKPTSNNKGIGGRGYHLCIKCKKEVFGNS